MLKVGHRGARAYEPENTLRSFQKALELGVDAVELDVRRTKDAAIVVIHDEDIKRTTNGAGLVGTLTLKEIQNFPTEKNQHIPTLDEALECLGKKATVFIELKEVGLEEQVLAAVKKQGSDAVLVSFHEDALRRVRELDPIIETGLIYVKHKTRLRRRWS
jgi:glycerophosphoryl diester phosphodiesterase